MKKIFALIFSLILFLSILTSCDSSPMKETNAATSHGQETQIEKGTSSDTQTQNETETENITEEQETDSTESNAETEAQSEEYDPSFGIVCGTYIRENERDLDGYFTISLGADGTFWYYETPLSSHIGKGEYTVEGNIITLVDEAILHYDFEEEIFVYKTHIYKLEYRDGTLIFLASESDKFIYTNLPEGAVFSPVPEE